MPQFTAERRRVAPTPIIAVPMVVGGGKRYPEAGSKQDRSAGGGLGGKAINRFQFSDIDTHGTDDAPAPSPVPIAITVPQRNTTQSGTWKLGKIPPKNSAREKTPMNFCPIIRAMAEGHEGS